MRELKRLRSARIIAAGHAFIQNLRRGQYDVVADQPSLARVRIGFDQVTLCIGAGFRPPSPQVKIIPRWSTQKSPSAARLAVVKS